MKLLYNAVRIIIISLITMPILCQADVPTWKILSDQSSLKFRATQNDAPVVGEFKNFTANIHFDPKNLSQSRIWVIIDLNSILTSYKTLADTLKTAEWLNVKLFPTAIYSAMKFSEIEPNTFEAKGNLILNNKKVPTVLTFVLKPVSSNVIQAKGSTVIKRNTFNIGRGEWVKIDEVKDNVQIDFIITATKGF